MSIITYDCEVFTYDWLVTFKDKKSGNYTYVWNDAEALKDCISDDNIYFGFNSKHYDQYILKAIVSGFTNEEVKRLSDYLIAGNPGWEYSELNDRYFKFNNVDLTSDMQMGLSLKSIEGHLGLPIKESEIDFNIDRPLTEAEREETERYCKHDVDTAEQLIDLRKSYFENKLSIGRMAGLDDIKSLAMTNAKLTAAMLKAKPIPHDDERDYVFPDNFLVYLIPGEVLEFFNRIHDKNLSDKEVFDAKYTFNIGECVVTLGFGGIHGAIPNFMWKKGNGRIGINLDVTSYYPFLMILCHYTSRNIPDSSLFTNVVYKRKELKKQGNKSDANALKLVVNTTFGGTGDKYNDLYDPLMARSVCITGQIYLLELAMNLYTSIPGLVIYQLNTDGIGFECDEKDYDKVKEIANDWQERLGFELEEESIVQMCQKDVNNYVEVQEDGSIKNKGGYLVRGIAPAGAWKINNNAVIVANAIQDYLLNNIPVEETINACDDIFQFQLIAKTGTKYREAYHLVEGKKIPVQRVNRVYATTDTRYGKLYKVKAENDSEAKIEQLPEHCIIDNDNKLTIKDIDKSFYIELAKKRINDFLGSNIEQRGNKMAKTTDLSAKNVYQKLILARHIFLNSGIEKSGKNMNLAYKYFELADIVPTATKIFNDLGLLAVDSFQDDVATMTIYNTDCIGESIVFTLPFTKLAPIVSNSGKMVTNEAQSLGSSITYTRRYLWQIAMDIVEVDEMEANMGMPDIPAPTPAPVPAAKKPATTEERKEIKAELTQTDAQADKMQINALKKVLKDLKAADPDSYEFIAKVAVDTEGFSNITKLQCESLINEVNAKLGEVNGK